MDEKLWKYAGKDSPCTKFVLSKPDRNGHWVTELTVILDHCDLPFCVGLYPFDPSASNITMTDIFTWAIQPLVGISEKPIQNKVIVTDSYYLDNTSRNDLINGGFKFMSCLNKERFQNLIEPYENQLNKCNDGFTILNENTNEILTGKWFYKLGKKYILSNAFKMGRKLLTSKSVEPGTVEYKLVFNYCDRYNNGLKEKKWPYRRTTWTANIDDFLFTAVLQNCHHMFLHNELKTKEQTDSCYSFSMVIRQLGLQIIEKALKLK